MIDIKNLRFRYPNSDFLLEIPEFSVPPKQKVAIVGPSGSGKTTLLNLMAGISESEQGVIQIAGHLVSEMGDAQRRNFRIANIGLVFQQFELVEYLNVRDNILLPLAINKSLKLNTTVRQGAAALAKSVGLSDKLNRRPKQLSQGEQQRVAICRALIANPKLILADEPTGNLDPKNKRLILDLIFEQAELRGQTLIVVTHDMGILNGFDQVVDFEQFRVEV